MSAIQLHLQYNPTTFELKASLKNTANTNMWLHYSTTEQHRIRGLEFVFRQMPVVVSEGQLGFPEGEPIAPKTDQVHAMDIMPEDRSIKIAPGESFNVTLHPVHPGKDLPFMVGTRTYSGSQFKPGARVRVQAQASAEQNAAAEDVCSNWVTFE